MSNPCTMAQPIRNSFRNRKEEYQTHLLWRSGPFLGRKSATVSTVNIPATYPLLKLNFPPKPPILKSSLPRKKVSSAEPPMTATKQVLLQPFGREKPANIANSLSILKTKSKGKEYSGKKELQWVSATSQQSSNLASRTTISGNTVGNSSTTWLALQIPIHQITQLPKYICISTETQIYIIGFVLTASDSGKSPSQEKNFSWNFLFSWN